jgi:hypothetical protein
MLAAGVEVQQLPILRSAGAGQKRNQDQCEKACAPKFVL